MSMGKPEWPEVGDLVVATVQRIVGHGAYVTLDEHDGKEGLLHISEISSRWVRNIRNHVRERQKLVLQVMRVDPSRQHIDLSLRRVNQDERRKKLEAWKKHRKAETLITGVASRLGVEVEDLFEKIGARISEHHGSLYEGLEATAKRGAEALIEAGVPEETAKILEEIAKDKIVIKGVTIHGELEMTSMSPTGVEEIKDTLMGVMNVAAEFDAEASIYSLGAPKYRIDITADDYKKAETVLDRIVDYTTEAWSDHDGTVSFKRN